MSKMKNLLEILTENGLGAEALETMTPQQLQELLNKNNS